MKRIVVRLNCTTEQEYFKMLGILLVAQKLLNDYLARARDEGIGPEGFAEGWIKDFGGTGPDKDLVLQAFFTSLVIVGKDGFNRERI